VYGSPSASKPPSFDLFKAPADLRKKQAERNQLISLERKVNQLERAQSRHKKAELLIKYKEHYGSKLSDH